MYRNFVRALLHLLLQHPSERTPALPQVNCPDVSLEALEEASCPTPLHLPSASHSAPAPLRKQRSLGPQVHSQLSSTQESLAVSESAQLYRFRYNARRARSQIVHFQLRNLVYATSSSIAYVAGAGGLMRWDALTRSLTRALDCSRLQVSTIAAHTGAELLCAGGFNGELLVRRLSATSEAPTVFSGRVSADETAITNAVEMSTAGGAARLFCSNNDCVVRQFDAGGGSLRMLSAWRLAWPVNYTAISPDATLAAVVGDACSSLLLDARTGDVVNGSLDGHLDFSFAAAWHPGGVLFATGSQDCTARVWDVRQLSTALCCLKGKLGAMRCLRFSPDGAVLAAAEPADFVHLYDVAAGFSQSQVVDFFGEISGLGFNPVDEVSDGGEALFVGIADQTYGSLLELERRRPLRSLYNLEL